MSKAHGLLCTFLFFGVYDVCVCTRVCVYLALKEHCGKGGRTIEPEDQEFYCETVSSISDREVSCTYEISMIMVT